MNSSPLGIRHQLRLLGLEQCSTIYLEQYSTIYINVFLIKLPNRLSPQHTRMFILNSFCSYTFLVSLSLVLNDWVVTFNTSLQLILLLVFFAKYFNMLITVLTDITDEPMTSFILLYYRKSKSSSFFQHKAMVFLFLFFLDQ